MKPSGGQPLAAARAAGCDDPATANCRHAGAETVAAFAHKLAGLIGAFHLIYSGSWDFRAHRSSPIGYFNTDNPAYPRRPSRPLPALTLPALTRKV